MQEAASKKQAKTLVALHGDQAIRENKGKDRPILEAKERLEVIDSIKFTDYVGIWQGWASIVDLVRDLRPKFLVVNAHALVEADWQDNWHTIAEEIEAEIISIEPLANTNSTSRIIEKIRQ
jgi:bifunctional ADP-heptose synthase (sugar kinase/adenylyltransferase)